MTPDRILTFGEFRLDPMSGHLFRGAEVVALAPKAFTLLQFLAGQAGRLVSKQELLSAVWPGVFVGDAVLKSTIRELRKALDDDSHEPRFIETAHRRGYRFMAPVTAIEAAAAGAPAAPRVSYAHSGSVNIAYQVIGSGPIDLVFVMGWVSHLEYFWNEPSFARFLTRLSSMARLILFDKRGTGLSDPVPVSELPSLDTRLDDVRAVMEAAGSRRAVLMGVSEGGPLCSLFAATYPEKTDALVMIGSYARRMRDADYPWGTTSDERDRFCQTIIDEWGGPVGLAERAPSVADDRGVSRVVVGLPAHGRQSRRRGRADAHERGDRRARRAAVDPRAGARDSSHRRSLPEGRGGPLSRVADPGRDLRRASRRSITCRLSAIRMRCSRRSKSSCHAGKSRGRRPPRSPRRSASPARGRPPRAICCAGCSIANASSSAAGPRSSATDHLVATFDGPGRAVQCAMSVMAIARQARIAARAGVHIGEFDVELLGDARC